MCKLEVFYYNCNCPGPEKCIESTRVVSCLLNRNNEDCGHNTPQTYVRVENFATGLCDKGHKERGR
ncbi:hypothetical protein RRF57_008164 [Xylaria bambusicola]|uniref:Uncharacterized protein n=1 Tax=Xylaria bambusicola TaxID=326684 RepID=A0AAN7Z0F8_9PEZI